MTAAVHVPLRLVTCRGICPTGPTRAHHDRLLTIDTDEDALLELMDLAVTWHELDYSASHDRAGYASIAGLRYLLARLLLSRTTCPAAADIHEQDVCRLHDFLYRWMAVRAGDRKSIESQLQRGWSDLRPLVFAGAPRSVGQAAAAAGDQSAMTDIWSELDTQLAGERPCSVS